MPLGNICRATSHLSWLNIAGGEKNKVHSLVGCCCCCCVFKSLYSKEMSRQQSELLKSAWWKFSSNYIPSGQGPYTLLSHLKCKQVAYRPWNANCLPLKEKGTAVSHLYCLLSRNTTETHFCDCASQLQTFAHCFALSGSITHLLKLLAKYYAF